MWGCIPLFNVIPEVYILANSRVATAKVQDEFSIQKHPDIVISKEEIFQIAAIVMRDREIDGEMHSEIAVMIQCVIGNRKRFPTT